jgi:MFS transporter, DHA2 family, multidrug resistance protein
MAMAATASRPAVAEYKEYSAATRWVIMVAVMLGTLMEMIDSSIVNVAIPTMRGNLNATLEQISWVTTGYILASVIMLPLTGWLSTVFGRRKYLAGSMALFTLASVLCGASRSLGALVAFRILQGIGGAALMSTAQATMMEIFPPAELGMVQAVYGLGIIVGPTLGPTLGGWIVDNASWPWIFYINLPIGILATIVTWTFMHDSRHKRVLGRIDFLGIAVLAIGLGCLQLLLEKGPGENWFEANYIVWLAVGAVLGIVAFVLWELRIKHPVVNLRVLRHRSFAAGVFFGAVLGLGLYGAMFALPVFLQGVKRFSAMETGMVMLPGALAAACMMPVVGMLVSRVRPVILVGIGVVGMAVTTYWLHTITQDTGYWDLFWPLVCRGACMGFLFAPLSLATLLVLHGRELPEGTALFNLSRQLGGSIGIAFIATFVHHRADFHLSRMLEHLSAYNPTTWLMTQALQHGLVQKGFSSSEAAHGALQLLQMKAQLQASILAYEDVFVLVAFLLIASLPLLLLFNTKKGGLANQRAHAPAIAE